MFLNTYSFKHALKLKTPEGINFELPLAGFFSRFLALVLDQAVIITGITVITTISGIARVISGDFAISFIIIMQFLLSTGYGILLEWIWNGQTIGKKVLKIQVVDQMGMRLTFPQVVIRNLIRMVDMLPALYGIGAISAFFSPYNKRLGDIAANTIVIAINKQEIPDFEQLTLEKFNSLRGKLGIIAKLRNQCSNQIAYISLHALIRRDELNPEARIDVFKNLATYFKEILGSELDDINTLSDEKLVRNIVEVIFQPDKN